MSEKNLKPKMRFKGNKDEWNVKPIGSIGSIAMCKRVFKYQTSDKDEVPFFKIGTFGGEPDAFISKELYDELKSKYKYPNKGAILISASGTIGKIVEYCGKDEYFQDSNIIWIDHNEEIIDKYIKYYLQVINWYGLEGSTIKRLYNNNILKSIIKYPKNTAEQTQIGEFFDDTDKLIKQSEERVEKWKNIRTSLLSKMFPKDGEKVPELRFKGFTGEWEEKKISLISNYFNGKGYEHCQKDRAKYELVNLNSISIDGGLKESGKYIDYAEETLRKGDLVMILSDVTHGNLLGRVAIIPVDNRYVLNQRVALIRVHDKNIDPMYLFYCINANQKYFKQNGAGSSQQNISRETVENFNVIFPSYDEQQKIARLLCLIDKLLELNQKRIDRIVKIKNKFLNSMFV